MKYQVVLTARAARDLDEAYLWIARQSPEAARRWYNGFLKMINGLELYAERCSFARENANFSIDLRQILYGRRRTYRALFTIRGSTVVVLHIRHTARDDVRPEDLI